MPESGDKKPSEIFYDLVRSKICFPIYQPDKYAALVLCKSAYLFPVSCN